MYRLFVVTFAAVPFWLNFTMPRPAPELIWWTTHVLDKVRPHTPPPEEPQLTARIKAARNEFESFQVVLRSPMNDIRNVDVEITDLRGRGDAVISKDNVSIYFERFLDVKVPSNIEGGAGEWPDPLIPRIDRYKHEKRSAFPFTLSRRRNQPIWIEVFVPPTAAAGSYEGQVHVSMGGKREQSIPVELEVWNFQLPSTSSMPVTFGFSGVGALRQHFGKYTSDRDLYDLTFLYQKSALWHRISLHGGSGVPPAAAALNGRLELDWANFDAENAPFMDGTAFGANEPLHGAAFTAISMRAPPALKTREDQIQFWRQVTDHFRERGWLDRLFHYLWDEPKPPEYAKVLQLGQLVREAAPEIKNLVTAPLKKEWSGFVDIWSPVINCFERKPGHDDFCESTVGRAEYDKEPARGKPVWWYQSCGSHGCEIVGGKYFTGWPSYMIDHDGVQNRIMQWVSWKYGIAGELYFATNEAFFRTDPWEDVRLYGGNGDGTLFYPGRPNVIGGTTHIPIESLRLKLIREGLEDYEYLLLLSRREGHAAAAELVNSFIRNTYDYDHDPGKLYSIRETMGRRLSMGEK